MDYDVISSEILYGFTQPATGKNFSHLLPSACAKDNGSFPSIGLAGCITV
ncbi:MAG: hypothetical protein IKS74_06340 [Methanomicrobium sp.]|nr:hypothetical protein [Methanomicrobium sp.]